MINSGRVALYTVVAGISLLLCSCAGGGAGSTTGAVETGSNGGGLGTIEQRYAKHPDNPAIAIRYAIGLRKSGQLNKAKSVLLPFTQGNDSYPPALTEISMVYIELGEYKKAEQKARESITKDAKQARAFLALGTALDAQKHYPQAEVAFRKGLEIWEGDPAPIMNNLALNLASQGHLEEALKMLEKALEKSPGRMDLERNRRIIASLLEEAGGPAPAPASKPEGE